MARNRYGRNQKRQHREAIARLEAEVHQLQGDALACRIALARQAEALAAQRAELERLVEEIRAVCRDSALLPANETALPGEGPWQSMLVEPFPLRCKAFDYSLDEPMLVATVDFWEVRAYLEQNRETFTKIVHLKLPAHREVRFAMSREAMAAFARHGLRQVAENLLSMLMAALRSDATAAAGSPPPACPARPAPSSRRTPASGPP